MKARSTIYNGVQMRSRLEAGYAGWLDLNNVRWTYEPCAFGSEDGQYLPDFELHDIIPGRRVFVEVKPERFELHHERKRMRVIWDSIPDAICVIEAEGYQWPHLGMRTSDGQEWWGHTSWQEENGLLTLHKPPVAGAWSRRYWEVA